MRFILLTILAAIAVIIVNPIIPYWGVMILIAIISTMIFPNGIGGFLGGGLGMGLTWLGQCIYLGLTAGSPLPEQMAKLMGLGTGMTLVVITGIIGFILGGLSGWTGVLFRRLAQRNSKNPYRK